MGGLGRAAEWCSSADNLQTSCYVLQYSTSMAETTCGPNMDCGVRLQHATSDQTPPAQTKDSNDTKRSVAAGSTC